MTKKFIIGCDEVGRGPIAGPVVGCAVKIDSIRFDELLRSIGVTDSKKLTEKKRKALLQYLGIDTRSLKANQKYQLDNEELSFEYCICSVSEKKIDEINILQASLLAMKNATVKLDPVDENIIIDGNKVFTIKGHAGEIDSLVKGDSKSVAIGLASIIAKDFRDEMMKDFDVKYPGYGLARHAGYPTKAHKEAVKELGVTPIHRRSFKGVKEYC